MSERLLPSNQTPLEAALARVLRPSVDPEILRTLMDVDRCPAAFLPWLAWSVAVDGWELAESDDARRALIKGSLALHRRKGTPWAVREIVRRLGFGEIEIQEGRVAKRAEAADHARSRAGADARDRALRARAQSTGEARLFGDCDPP
ncbi:phage tail protein I [Burkholderia pseudomallei]|nr:phage tail protein I [Burkholderia pseudomallei]